MDDIVKKALEKWPNVPDCYGWLALDQRGKWYMRDDRIQAQGFFPHPKGSWLQHEKLIDFIDVNSSIDFSERVDCYIESSKFVMNFREFIFCIVFFLCHNVV